MSLGIHPLSYPTYLGRRSDILDAILKNLRLKPNRFSIKEQGRLQDPVINNIMDLNACTLNIQRKILEAYRTRITITKMSDHQYNRKTYWLKRILAEHRILAEESKGT